MNKNIDLSIIIVTHNSEEYIDNCIESITDQNFDNFEIIIVDNSSIDNTADKIQKYLEKNVKVKFLKKNLGFSSAVNIGIKDAEGDKIFLLNPDTKMKKNSVKSLLNKLERSDYKIIIPQIINQKNKIFRSVWRFPTLLSSLGELVYLDWLFYKKNYNDKDHNKPFEVESASGAALLFYRKVIDKLGFFNENFFWCEDIDFCKRLHKNKYKILFYPKSKVIHYGGKSSDKNPKIRIINQLLSKVKYFNAYHNVFEQKVLYFGIICIATIKILIFMLIAIFFPKKYKPYIISYLTAIKLLIKNDLKVYL